MFVISYSALLSGDRSTVHNVADSVILLSFEIEWSFLIKISSAKTGIPTIVVKSNGWTLAWLVRDKAITK